MEDWHNWGKAKTRELEGLERLYDECQRSLRSQSGEMTNLKESKDELKEEDYKECSDYPSQMNIFTRTVSESQEQSLASQTAQGSTYGPCIIVKLSHPCSPGKYVEGAALIDSQSTCTWVTEGLCDDLGVEDRFVKYEGYTLSTMESDGVRHGGRAIRGLEIAPCIVPQNGNPQGWSLPKCMERSIPSVVEEVASYEDVNGLEPHLAQYCDNFPPKQQWKTIILLGRDCPWAMRQTMMNNPEEDRDLNPYPIPRNEFDRKNLTGYGPSRWKRVEFLADVFWNERRTQYLYKIGGSREKWLDVKRNAQVGDLVLIKDKNQHRSNWPTGHITKVYKSADGLVRSATVKPYKRPDLTITERERDRPIVDLILLREAPSETQPNPTHPKVSERDKKESSHES